MIFGAHVILYSKDADADRAFLSDVVGLSSVDAGHGWLIFALPPAEVAVHPENDNDLRELYFMCDDLKAEVAALKKKGVDCTEVHRRRAGELSRESNYPAEGCWACISPNTRWQFPLKPKREIWRCRPHLTLSNPLR